MKQIKKEEFERLLKNPIFIVLFTMKYCGPCATAIAQLIHIQDQFKGLCPDIYIIDSKEEKWLSEKYSILEVPTFLIFKNGEPVNMIIGIRPTSYYLQAIMS